MKRQSLSGFKKQMLNNKFEYLISCKSWTAIFLFSF